MSTLLHTDKQTMNNTNNSLHYFINLEGCNISEQIQLTNSFSRLLNQFIIIINNIINQLLLNNYQTIAEKNYWIECIEICLKSISLDYIYDDHILLLNSGMYVSTILCFAVCILICFYVY